MLPSKQKDDEVALTQYLRPDGTPVTVFAPVGRDYVKKAEGMVLSCEHLTTGQVALYARWQTEPVEAERMEIAENGVGKNDPVTVLRRLIDKVVAELRVR